MKAYLPVSILVRRVAGVDDDHAASQLPLLRRGPSTMAGTAHSELSSVV